MKFSSSDDGHNTYVLYSDLLFNLLILFVLIVLALVLKTQSSINDSDNSRVALEQQTKLAQDQARLAQDREANAEKWLQQEANKSKELEGDKEKLAESLRLTLVPNRFARSAANARWLVAVDFSTDPPHFIPIPWSTVESLLEDHSGDEHDRDVRVAKALSDAISNAPRLSKQELEALSGSLMRDVVPAGNVRFESGCLIIASELNGPAGLIASGWEGSDGVVHYQDIPSAIAAHVSNGMNDFGSFCTSTVQSVTIPSHRQRPSDVVASVPVLHFSLPEDGSQTVLLGNSAFSYDDFRKIVSSFGGGGIAVEYDSRAGEPCPVSFYNSVLAPIAYTEPAPDPNGLRKLRDGIVSGGN